MKLSGALTVPFAVLVLGAGGIAVQAVQLRELLILFGGNEFSIGTAIGFWIVCEAAGGLAAGARPMRPPRRRMLFVEGMLFFGPLFGATIYATRIFKTLAGIPVELAVGLPTMLFSSFLLMLPVAFVHGFLFVLSCGLYDDLSAGGAASTGRAYTVETVGTIAGGVIVSYLLIPHTDSFTIAGITTVANALSCWALVWEGRSDSDVLLRRSALVTAAVCVLTLLGGGGRFLNDLSVATQWQRKEVIEYRNSYYQNIAVVKTGQQYTFFTDGLPSVTTPVPDITFVEELGIFPLLAHRAPRDVLVIAGGAGGLITEILKHQGVRRVDYVELDPALLDAIRRHPTGLTEKELSNGKVRLHAADGRLFVKGARAAYDVIILNMAVPRTLQANRLFTVEFFQSVRDALRPEGVFALTAAGSLTYYTAELKRLNACLINTLDEVFPRRLVIPGDWNLFIVSPDSDVAALTGRTFISRLAQRAIDYNVLAPGYIEYRLGEAQRQWFLSAIAGAAAKANRDFAPFCLYYAIMYDNLLFTPRLNGLFSAFLAGGVRWSAALVVLISVAAAVATGRSRRRSVMYAVATTGFSAMAFELLLFFAFQVLYGYVFHQAGLLITAFMGGIAAGSIVTTRVLRAPAAGLRMFIRVEAAIIIFAMAVAVVFAVIAGKTLPLSAGFGLIVTLLGISGFLTGMEFPLANALYAGSADGKREQESVEKTAGVVYGADLVGGWLGGILAGFFLFSVLGLVPSLILLAALKSGSLSLILFSRST